MASLGAAGEEKAMKTMKLDWLIAAEVEAKLQEEVPKLARQVTSHVAEKVRKRIEMETSQEKEVPMEEEEPPTKKAKTYHLGETEEEIRKTLSEPRCFRCKIPGHTLSTCTYGRKMCFYCNQLGHSYDECVERMVTKREVVQDPYFPVYDPWEYERIQYK